jgi:hypothetical protein
MNGGNRIRLLRARSTDHGVQAEAIATEAVGYESQHKNQAATSGHGLKCKAA